MAWTTPATWVDGQVVNATDMNTQVRDNANALYAMANAPYRNLLYNGAMQIAQRGTSTASITTTGYYTADRWQTVDTTLGTWTQSVAADAPTARGFVNSLKMLCTTADASPAAGDALTIQQTLEGYDVQRLLKGTSSAQALTLSFWVKSNKTGTYIVECADYDNTRSTSQSYTIDATDTWEQKTITIPADTTGTLANDNGSSLGINFWLAAGSNYTSGTLATSWGSQVSANRAVGQANLADATSNYWQITGVQLDVGSVATPFEFLPYGDELRRCQRYYQTLGGGSLNGICASTTAIHRFGGLLAVPMRAAPTTVAVSGSIGVFDGTGVSSVTSAGNTYSSTTSIEIDCTITVGAFAQYRPVRGYILGGGGFLTASAEL